MNLGADVLRGGNNETVQGGIGMTCVMITLWCCLFFAGYVVPSHTAYKTESGVTYYHGNNVAMLILLGFMVGLSAGWFAVEVLMRGHVCP